MTTLTLAELEAGLSAILEAPRDAGVLEMIVRRPEVDAREVLEEGTLDLDEGLVGDNWKAKGSRKPPGSAANPDMQLNLMGARTIALVAGERARWALAGDQLYIDLDMSEENLPPGTRLAIGEAIIEITAEPHTGCKKFAARFGLDAMRFINAPERRHLHLRGLNARIVQPGIIRRGDVATKIPKTA